MTSLPAQRLDLAVSILETAAFARGRGIALPADLALDVARVRQALAIEKAYGAPMLPASKLALFADDPLDEERRDAEQLIANALYLFFTGQWRRLRGQLRTARSDLLAAQGGRMVRRLVGMVFNLDWGKEAGWLWTALAPTLDDVIETAGRSAWRELVGMGVGLAWDIFDLAAQQWALKYKYDLVTRINTSTQTMLGRVLSRWIASDEDFDQLTERVWKVVPTNPYPNIVDRPRLIAQTETTRVYAESRMAGLKAAGLRRMTWQTANDELVCRVCLPLHGREGSLEMGVLNPENGRYYKPPAHPGCRCWLSGSTAELQARVGQPEYALPLTAAEIAAQGAPAVEKHHGPGPHPGTGTPQSVHGGGDGGQQQAQQQWQRKYRPADDYERNADAYAQRDIESTAQWQGVTPERVQKKVTQYLAKLLNAPLVIRANLDGAFGIINDGRFKSQFESRRSNGMFNPDVRAMAERHGLGIPEDIDHAERPIYGYFDFRGDDGAPYGEIKFTLKESVKQRTTFTVGDSLGRFEDGTMTGSLVSEPHDIGAWDGYVDTLYRNRAEFPYLEAQIHGGVTLDDVESVTLMMFALDYDTGKPKEARGREPGDWRALEKLLRSRGIKVKYDKETP